VRTDEEVRKYIGLRSTLLSVLDKSSACEEGRVARDVFNADLEFGKACVEIGGTGVES
jgi:hypothetical protein